MRRKVNIHVKVEGKWKAHLRVRVSAYLPEIRLHVLVSDVIGLPRSAPSKTPAFSPRTIHNSPLTEEVRANFAARAVRGCHMDNCIVIFYRCLR